MKELTFLTPAETLLLLSPANSKLEEFARVTFFDLLLRKILNIELIESAENYYETKTIKQVVSLGQKFNFYKLEKHEFLFINPFNNDPELKISLRNLVKAAFEGIKSTDEFKLKYLYNNRITIYFSTNLIQRLFGIKVINSKGIELQKNILKVLNSLEKDVETIKKTKLDKDLLAKRLLSINGNILLLKNIDISDFDILKKYDENKSVTNNKDTEYRYDYGLFHIWSNQFPDNNYNLMTEISNLFHDCLNTSTSNNSSETDSIDSSGDSGCSGCSGCGD